MAETETKLSPAEIETKLKELKDIKKEQDADLQNLQSNAFNLANYYFVFQGVIITAICSGTSALNCSDRWFLFTVSLLAAILNIVAISLIGIKYMRVIRQRDQNWCEICELEIGRSKQDSPPGPPSTAPGPPSTAPPPDQASDVANDAGTITSENQDLPFMPSAGVSSSSPFPDRGNGQGNSGQCKDRYKDFKRYLTFGVCMGLFVGFAGVTLYNCWHIVCRKNQAIKNSYLDPNCIRLCDSSKCIRVCSEL